MFFGADTLLIPELSEVARRFPKIDLALLPINGLRYGYSSTARWS